MISKNFAIIDVETTGGSSRWGKVIEIGILRVEHGEIVQTFETLVNPGMEIPSFITELTGISGQDLVSAPSFDDIKDEVLELLTDAVFVAHNVSFDYGFIKQEFKRVDYAFNSERMCTVKLSRTLFPEHKRHNLTELIQRFDFECKRRHRALDDAKVLWEFMQMVNGKFEKNDVYSAMIKAMTRTRTPKKKSVLPDALIAYEPYFE
jgi:DNA polymerase-3 subunit epsilon